MFGAITCVSILHIATSTNVLSNLNPSSGTARNQRQRSAEAQTHSKPTCTTASLGKDRLARARRAMTSAMVKGAAAAAVERSVSSSFTSTSSVATCRAASPP